MRQQRYIENQEVAAMDREDKLMHKVVADEKQQRKIVQLQKLKEQQQEQIELLAMAKQEKLQQDIQEQKRRIRQSQQDKSKYLAQLQEQQREKEEKTRKQAEQQRLFAQQQSRDCKESQAVAIDNEILKTAIAEVSRQKIILQAVPKIDARISYEKFLQESAKNPEIAAKFLRLFARFNLIVHEIAADDLKDTSIDRFDSDYEDILKNHKKLCELGAGISYFMAFSPELYGCIVNSYVQLRQKIGSQTSASLSCNFDRLQNNLSLGQGEFATLKTLYAAALKNNDTAASNQYLSVMKDKKKSLDAIQKQLHENQILMKQQYVFACLLKTCGNGGILDPCRFIQPLEKSVFSKRAMPLEKLDAYFVMLNNRIEDVLKISDDEQDPAKIDPLLKISAPKMRLVHDQTLQMIDAVLREIGLESHPKKQEWALKFYNNARMFSYDDARNYIDLDGYRYSLQKIFDSKKEGCTLAQHNSMQDLFMKLIRLYKNKFHEKP
jgi:hypothetical protein